MKRAALLFVLAAAAIASQAQNQPLPPPPPAAHDHSHPFRIPGSPAKTIPAPKPWLTGGQLLQQLDPPAGSPHRQATIRESVKYLMGIYDATESSLWCYTDYKGRPTPKQSPDVMRAKTIAWLRKLPATRLQEKAAVLVVDMWQYDWPCPPDGCCPGRGQ